MDILVVKDMDLPRYKRSREIRKYLRGVKVPVDLHVYTQKEIDEWKGNKSEVSTSNNLRDGYPTGHDNPYANMIIKNVQTSYVVNTLNII